MVLLRVYHSLHGHAYVTVRVSCITQQEKASDEPQPSTHLASDSDAPILELEPWYYGNIDSCIACKKCKEDGDFLVRYSVKKQKYIISCRWENTCHHCIVDVSRAFTLS